MDRNDGGPAFPLHHATPRVASTDGMTLRDYFAAKALPAVIAAYIEANGRCIGTPHVKYNCSTHAYDFADAMLAERAKERT